MAKSYKSKSDNIYKTNKNEMKCQELRARMKSYCRLMVINKYKFAEELGVDAAEPKKFMTSKNDVRMPLLLPGLIFKKTVKK